MHAIGRFSLASTLLFSLLLLTSCGDDVAEQDVEHGGELQTGSEPEATDSIPTDEVDSIVGRYFTATDSLANLFDSIETIEDVNAAASEITRLNEDIWEFNRLSVQYGQVLLDRMDQMDRGGSLEHLLNARSRLQEMPEVYAVVEQIEKDVPGRNSGDDPDETTVE